MLGAWADVVSDFRVLHRTDPLTDPTLDAPLFFDLCNRLGFYDGVLRARHAQAQRARAGAAQTRAAAAQPIDFDAWVAAHPELLIHQAATMGGDRDAGP